MDIPRLFFTIPELAARWNCSENEIIHLAAARKIFLAVNMTPFSPLPVSGWWNPFLPGEIATLLTGQQLFHSSYFHDPSDEKNRDSFVRFKKEDGIYRAFEFHRSDVVVLGKDVERFEKESQGDPADDFIGFHETINLLQKKWQATEEELAAWIFLGPDKGGVAAYIAAYNPPRSFSFSYSSSCRKYLPLLGKCCFHRRDIEGFKPIERYITGKNLLERWGHVRLGSECFIRARIEESRMMPFHPTFGSTREVFEENASDTNWPTLEECLFPLQHVEKIKLEEGLVQLAKDNIRAYVNSDTLSCSSNGKTIIQQQKFRELCIDELRDNARQWINHFFYVPIKKFHYTSAVHVGCLF